jgi:hypothetical protein
MGDNRSIYIFLAGKSEGNRLLERPDLIERILK